MAAWNQTCPAELSRSHALLHAWIAFVNLFAARNLGVQNKVGLSLNKILSTHFYFVGSICSKMNKYIGVCVLSPENGWAPMLVILVVFFSAEHQWLQWNKKCFKQERERWSIHFLLHYYICFYRSLLWHLPRQRAQSVFCIRPGQTHGMRW